MSSTAPTPRVAVVIPCHKQAHYLGDAIDSALRQTYPASEIVVVDDGSPDHVADVVARYPGVRYIRQSNQGLSAARNTGIRATTSELLVFLDSDDRLLLNALARGVEHLSAHPDCAFAAGRMHIIDANGAMIRPWKPFAEADDYLGRLFVDHCNIYPVAVMYRRSAIEEVGGGFNTSLRSAEDWDMDIRLARRFPFHLYNEPIAEYRKHGDSMTGDAAVMMTSILRVLREQRRYVRGTPRYVAACRAGMRHARLYFSELIIEQIHGHISHREWRRALEQLWVLTRWHPHIYVERAALKLQTLRSERGSTRTSVERRVG
jgi:glycosyltransferase involved in cell wall biosynthesis